MISKEQHLQILQEKIKTLYETVWARKADWPLVTRWFEQFSEAAEVENDEQLHALHLLSQFMFFGSKEIRALLRSLYRDLIRHSIIRDIRLARGNTTDRNEIELAFRAELAQTRFVALGNPSESSAMLLYFFRQENALPKSLFATGLDVFDVDDAPPSLRDPTVKRFVLIDDLCGSGDQGVEYSKTFVEALQKLDNIEARYYALFACSDGLEHIRTHAKFDIVDVVVELDSSFKCFSENSRYFAPGQQPFERETAEHIFREYGLKLWPDYPLGYQDCQLLLGFDHNTPDNTIPTFWSDDNSWSPVFRRYPKVDWS